METTFFRFSDMDFKVTRPKSVEHLDKDVGNRAHEILNGVKEEDDWTKDIDKIIADNNITFEKVSKEEIEAFIKKSNSVTARL